MNSLENINWKKVGIHILFWIVGFGIIVLINELGSVEMTQQGESFTLTQRPSVLLFALFIYLFILILPIYINTYLLIPKLWYRYNIVVYTLGLVVMLVVLLESLEWMDFIETNFIVYFFFFCGILLQTLIFFAIEGAKDRERLQVIHLEQNDMELKLLKGQINPHFLFNALNNLYSLSLFEPKQTPDAILQLSSLMRYSVESSKKTLLSLQEEVKFIESYIYLEQMRLNPQKVSLAVSFDSIPKSLEISPMLLIPFVENAFKHGISAAGGKISIQLKVLENQQIEFTVKNTTKPKQATDNKNSTHTGLENTQKRLNLLYPAQHKLEIISTTTSFEIYLKLTL